MIFLIGLMFACLFLLLWLEKVPWEDELEIRRLIKQSRENERRRARHRKTAYTQCDWRPPMTRGRFKSTALRFHRNMV